VTEDLVRADDDGESVMTMLRGADLSDALLQPAADDGTGDPLAGPFAHVVVDEAQELTDAEWQMVLARCPVRSLTVVGDRAQARAGFVEPWTELLARVGLPGAAVATLSISYRTPAEVMAVAEPVIRAVLPDVPVPTAVRTGGAVEHRPSGDLAAVVRDWLAADEGVVGVITADPARVALPAHPRVTVLDPVQAKGLEFDLVVLDGTVGAGTGGGATGSVAGAVDRYVAMTRATRRLVLPA
jgi:superfamily I DNA/RNA helicase